MKIVHRNLLLPLLSNPLDCAGEPDNSRSLVNPKGSLGTWVAIAVSVIASNVHYLGAYEGVQVTNLIQKGLNFVTTSVLEILRSTGYISRESIHLLA